MDWVLVSRRLIVVKRQLPSHDQDFTSILAEQRLTQGRETMAVKVWSADLYTFAASLPEQLLAIAAA